MKIKGLGPGINIPGAVKSKTETKPSENVDKIEISPEAKKLREVSVLKLDKIRQKLNTGFYNSEEVISKVADAVLKDLK